MKLLGGHLDPAKTVVSSDTVAWTVTRLRIAPTVLKTAEPCGEDAAMALVVGELNAMIERLELQLEPGA